jgi:hypothetical protein
LVILSVKNWLIQQSVVYFECWICESPPDDDQNMVEMYSLHFEIKYIKVDVLVGMFVNQ